MAAKPEERRRDDVSLSGSESLLEDGDFLDDDVASRSYSRSCTPSSGSRKRSPEARERDSGNDKAGPEARGSGSAAGEEDPLGTFFSGRPGSPERNAAQAPAQADKDDPMADFFSDRPKVKDIQDADEALRLRKSRDGTARSAPPKERPKEAERRPAPRREEAPARARERRGSARASGRSRSRGRGSGRGAEQTTRSGRGTERPARSDRGDRSERAVKSERNHAAASGRSGGSESRRVKEFVRDNGLDDSVANILYKMEKAEIATIIDQGYDLSSTRNPNAVAMSRIKRVQRGETPDGRPPKSSGRGHGEAPRKEARERGRGETRERGRGSAIGLTSRRGREHRAATTASRRSPGRRAELKGSTPGRSRRAEADDDRRTRRRH